MKKTLILTLTVLGTLFFSNTSYGQKIAHINSNELLQMMPEVKAANKQLEAYSQQFRSELERLTLELEKKYKEYSELPANTPPAIKESKEKEIQQIQERIETFKETAQESVQKKEQELLEPIVKKAKEAVQAVAKEQGYTYVFDSSQGAMIMFPESDNLMNLVKKRLGIVDEKPAAPVNKAPAPQGK
ncbi:MAG: OmpH family outer membrane protein [Bacteroidia bacterium]|nr:OmpH family outer membrane protein [Bacteroidia bacterium]